MSPDKWAGRPSRRISPTDENIPEQMKAGNSHVLGIATEPGQIYPPRPFSTAKAACPEHSGRVCRCWHQVVRSAPVSSRSRESSPNPCQGYSLSIQIKYCGAATFVKRFPKRHQACQDLIFFFLSATTARQLSLSSRTRPSPRLPLTVAQSLQCDLAHKRQHPRSRPANGRLCRTDLQT